MVVVLAGGIDQDRVEGIKQQVEEWFGTLRREERVEGREERVERPSDSQTEPRLITVTKPDANQAHIELGIRTFARTHEDRYAWGVFNLLMGVSFTSRLFREIREKKGLCYHIRSSSSNWSDVGYWSIYAGVATEKVEEAIAGIVEELTKVVQEGISADEVAVSKKRLHTMITFRSEDPEFINEYYGRQEVLDNSMITLDEYHKRIDQVTAEEINRLVRKYIVPQTMNAAVVWNKPHNEGLVNLLHMIQ
jgi:predicted Zn-dependent peptidase